MLPQVHGARRLMFQHLVRECAEPGLGFLVGGVLTRAGSQGDARPSKSARVLSDMPADQVLEICDRPVRGQLAAGAYEDSRPAWILSKHHKTV